MANFRVEVNQTEILNVETLTISLKYDSVASTFSITSRYNTNDFVNRRLLQPLEYHTVRIFRNDELILTASQVKWDIVSTEKTQTIKISGYSLAGVLEDTTLIFTRYPLETTNLNLIDIIRKFSSYYGLEIGLESGAQAEAERPFVKSVAQPTEKISAYLTKLTSQRNLILGHEATGDLIVRRFNRNARSVASYDRSNSISMAISVDGRNMHNQIAVLRQAVAPSYPERTAGQAAPEPNFFLIDNPLVSLRDEIPFLGVNAGERRTTRPITYIMNSGQDANLEDFSKSKLAKELTSITVKIALPRIELITPGDIIEIQNPDIYLNRSTRFAVREVNHKIDAKSSITNLVCILPEAITGDLPQRFFDE